MTFINLSNKKQYSFPIAIKIIPMTNPIDNNRKNQICFVTHPLIIFASKTTNSCYNLKILRPKVTKNLTNLRKKFCESPPRALIFHFYFILQASSVEGGLRRRRKSKHHHDWSKGLGILNGLFNDTYNDNYIFNLNED